MALEQEMVLKFIIDADTGQLRAITDEMGNLKNATNSQIQGFAQLQNVSNSTGAATDSLNLRMARSADYMASSALRATGLGQAMGPLPMLLLETGTRMEYLSAQGVQLSGSLGSVTQQMGALGPIALAAGAAFIGWKIGTMISDLTGLTKATKEYGVEVVGVSEKAKQAAMANEELRGQYEQMMNIMQMHIHNMQTFAQVNFAAVMKKADQEATDIFNEGLKSNEQKYRETLDEMAAIKQINLTSMNSKEQAAMAKQYAILAKQSAEYHLGMIKDDEAAAQKAVEIANQQAQQEYNIFKKAADAHMKLAQDTAKYIEDRDKEIETAIAQDQQEYDRIVRDALAGQASAYQPVIDKLSEYIGELQREIAVGDPISQQNLDHIAQMMALKTAYEISQQKQDQFKESALQNAAALKIAQAQAKELEQGIQDLGKAFDEFAKLIGGDVGGILSAFGGIANAFKGLKQDWNTAMSGFRTGGFGGIISGIGGIANIAGTAVGLVMNLVGAIAKLFQKDWVGDAKNMVEAIYGIKGASDDVIKAIGELAKKIGDEMVATVLSEDQLIASTGVNASNLAQYIHMLHDNFSLLQGGFITTAQAADDLNKNFQTLADASKDQFGVISDSMKEIISLAQQFGVKSQAITDFLNQQTKSLADATNTIIQNTFNLFQQTGTASLRSVKAAAVELLASFNAIIANGGSVADAMSALGGSVGQLKQLFQAMGLSAKDFGLQIIFTMAGINKKFADEIQILGAVQQSLTALDNMNMLTVKSFNALQHTAEDAFNKMGGLAGMTKAKMAEMLPTLLMLQYESQKYGYTLDPLIQKELDWAKAHGMIKQTDPSPTLQDTLSSLNTTLVNFTQVMAQAFGVTIPNAIAQTQHALNGIHAPNLNLNLGPPGRVAFAGLTKPIMFTGATPITAHYGEVLLPSPRNSTSTGHGPTSGPTYITIQAPVRDDYELARFIGKVQDERERNKSVQRY